MGFLRVSMPLPYLVVNINAYQIQMCFKLYNKYKFIFRKLHCFSLELFRQCLTFLTPCIHPGVILIHVF